MGEIRQIKEEIIDLAKRHSLYGNILKTNGKIVINRGSESPEFLFIGEAPGFTENKMGLPFVGRSGKIKLCLLAKSIISSFICRISPILRKKN